MKKMITGLLATTMCLSLCACRGAENDVLRITETPVDLVVAQDIHEQPQPLINIIPEITEATPEPETTWEDSDSDGYTCVEGVEALLSNPLYPRLQELMGFELTREKIDTAFSSEEHVAVMFEEHQLIVPDYIFELDNGTRLQLPMTYQDLIDAGWQSEEEMEPTEAVEGEQYFWTGFVNGDGKTISAEIGNYSASPIALKDATITQLQFGNCYTEGYSVNGIREGATVEEVMFQFGLPMECSYYRWEDGLEYFSFYYINDINYSHISFDFNTETGLLESINYCVLLHPDDRPA